MSSTQPRKQRKALYDAPLHIRRKQVASHLCEELLLKYNRRSLPVIKGDEVKILRGGHKGHTGRVTAVIVKDRKVVVEGVNHKKADGTDVPFPVDPSNLLVTKLNLEDVRRRAKLGEAKAEAEPAAKATKAAKTSKATQPAEAPIQSKEADE